MMKGSVLEKIKETIISIIKDPITSALKAAWYIICLGVAIWIVLYATAFVKYLLTTAFSVLGF
jgi:hypothetical protein